MRSISIVLAALALGACGEQIHGTLNDGGALPPTYEELDLASANLELAATPDGTSVLADLGLTGGDGSPVVLQQGQSVTVNGTSMIGDGGVYALTVPMSPSIAVKVDEPRHGVVTTTYSLPVAFQLTSGSSFNLAGQTLTWAPIEPGATVTLHFEQQSANGDHTADFTIAGDNGTRTFTDVEMRPFVQGYTLQLTIVKTRPGAPLQGVASSTVTLSRQLNVQLAATSSP